MKKQQESGDREWKVTRRGWLGALAGLAGVVASLRRERRETVAEKRRRGRFWIGHT